MSLLVRQKGVSRTKCRSGCVSYGRGRMALTGPDAGKRGHEGSPVPNGSHGTGCRKARARRFSRTNVMDDVKFGMCRITKICALIRDFPGEPCSRLLCHLVTSCPYLRFGLGIAKINFVSALDFHYICFLWSHIYGCASANNQ